MSTKKVSVKVAQDPRVIKFQEWLLKTEKAICENTANANSIIKKQPEKISPKAFALKKILDKVNECYSKTTVSLFLECLQYIDDPNIKDALRIPSHDEKVPFPFKGLSVVKVIGNPNSHNYPIGQPLLVVGGDHDDDDEKDHAFYLLDDKWKKGNHLPHDISNFALVTDKETQFVLDHINDIRTEIDR